MTDINKLNDVENETSNSVSLEETKSQTAETLKTEKLPEVIDEKGVLTIDGACPGWLLTTIAHALHPVCVAVKYPQGGPDAVLPVSGFEMEDEGKGQDIKFDVKELEDRTEITFSLENPNIDAQATINSLVAPKVPAGKPVYISGRGPIAILTALADAYAHKVPFVACFQPGTGNVVAISHSDTDLGTVL